MHCPGQETTTIPTHAAIPSAQQRRAAQANDLLPPGDWVRAQRLEPGDRSPAWILVVVVSGILFVGYTKAGVQPTLVASAGLGAQEGPGGSY